MVFTKQGMREVNPKSHQTAAVKAVIDGVATEQQQKTCMDFILRDICMIADNAFVAGPDGDRATLINLGRQMAGKLILDQQLPETMIRARGGQDKSDDEEV